MVLATQKTTTRTHEKKLLCLFCAKRLFHFSKYFFPLAWKRVTLSARANDKVLLSDKICKNTGQA